MAYLARFLSIASLAVLTLLPTHATAVTIDVTSGFLSARRFGLRERFNPFFSLSGESFSLTSSGGFPGFLANQFFSPVLLFPPRLGEPAELSGVARLFTDAFNVLVFEGMTYRASGELQFFATPVPTAPGGSVEAPFIMMGRIFGHLGCTGPVCLGDPDIELSLIGAGTVTGGFRTRPLGFIQFLSFRYDFSEIPEPSTWLLLATGVVAIGLMTKRRWRLSRRTLTRGDHSGG